MVICGGDGTVTACLSALADGGVPVAIVPCGTGNLLARNLGVPLDFAGAREVAFTGIDRPIDLGVLDAEPFAVGGCDSRLPCLLVQSRSRLHIGVAALPATVRCPQ